MSPRPTRGEVDAALRARAVGPSQWAVDTVTVERRVFEQMVAILNEVFLEEEQWTMDAAHRALAGRVGLDTSQVTCVGCGRVAIVTAEGGEFACLFGCTTPRASLPEVAT